MVNLGVNRVWIMIYPNVTYIAISRCVFDIVFGATLRRDITNVQLLIKNLYPFKANLRKFSMNKNAKMVP